MAGFLTFQAAVYRTAGPALCCILSTLVSVVAAAEPVRLVSSRAAGEISNVEVVLQIGGDLLLAKPGQTPANASVRKLPMSVAAKLQYDERTVALRNGGASSSRALRRYQSAKALVEIESGRLEPQLTEPHRLIAVEASKSEVLLTCPDQPLTREELDLIDISANTLLLDELLPTNPVAPGDVWKHSDDLMASLLRLDAVSLCDVQSMLAEVSTTENIARISLAGTVQGGVGGVATEIEVKAKYTFDLNQKRIIQFALLSKEKRSVGHVAPGFDTVVKQVIQIRPGANSETLSAHDIRPIARWFEASAQALSFASPHNGFRLEHDRRWFTTADDERLTVFRYVDRGELVAQCNVTLLPTSPTSESMKLADFQKDIEKSLGKQFGQFVSAREESDAIGRRVYRVVATGTASDLPIQWTYYLFTTRDGSRLSAAFSVEQSLVERFGSADREFLQALEIAPPQTAAGGDRESDKR